MRHERSCDFLRCVGPYGTGVLLVLLAFPSIAPSLRGAPADVLRIYEPTKADEALKKAVAYLLTQQNARTGAICNLPAKQPTLTALSILAMTAVGHQPSDPTPEGQALRGALEFVLKPEHQQENGFFGGDSAGMYGHGIITLMLSEMLGMGFDAGEDQAIRDRAQKAINLILQAQKVSKQANHQGGWRYQPNSPDSDLSITVWQLMALRSANNAGLDVPKESIDTSIDYVRGTYCSPRDAAGRPTNLCSGCTYQGGGGTKYTMAAAGLLSLQLCGQYESPEAYGSADWLLNHQLNYKEDFFFYGTYYFAQGMYQRGGKHAEEGKRRVEEAVLPRQEPDGSWRPVAAGELNIGKVYSTSMAILALAVKYHYLPIYQR